MALPDFDLKAALEFLPEEIRSLPEEQQLEYISQLLSHHHRHLRDEEEAKRLHEQMLEKIASSYPPARKHPRLYELAGWELEPNFLQAVESRDPTKMRSILKEETAGVYSFQMLTSRCCTELLEEVVNFEEWCKTSGLRVNRPNSMNAYGAILDDFGFKPALNQLMQQYVQPFAALLYPLIMKDSLQLDEHHGFVVEYELGKDTNLGFHVDDSEVTLNVCLGREFTGGQLYFAGVRCSNHVNTGNKPGERFELEHHVGRGVFHLGKHRHGALDITSGNRCNLILWCRSFAFRKRTSDQLCHEWCAMHYSK